MVSIHPNSISSFENAVQAISLTLSYRFIGYLFWHVNESAANWWRDVVREIFSEENLAYEIDQAGGAHPRVDREFQRNVVSAIVGLRSERYIRVRELIGSSSNYLCADPPNYKQAWRAILSAVEALFGLMFPYARLTTDEVEYRLQPLIEHVYQGDEYAQKAAQRMLAGFKEWIEASQNYRHHPGAFKSLRPPADIAILAISYGVSLLRWLAGFDEAMSPTGS